jgi:hypothetical protein
MFAFLTNISALLLYKRRNYTPSQTILLLEIPKSILEASKDLETILCITVKVLDRAIEHFETKQSPSFEEGIN